MFYAYLIQHNKEYDYHLIKYHFILHFNDIQYSTYVKSNLFDNKTKFYGQDFLEKGIDAFKNKRYNFNNIEEMNTIKIANKMDMSYVFII